MSPRVEQIGLCTKSHKKNKRNVEMVEHTDLEKTDPFVGEEVDGLEHDRADTDGLHTELVNASFGVGLVRVGHFAVHVHLFEPGILMQSWET